MRLRIFICLVGLMIFVASKLYAQNGFIRGTVFDAATGEFLPGVTVFMEGTTTGTITDLDGKFILDVSPGTYDLRISFISYNTQTFEGIQVTAGEVTILDELGLEEATIEISEVTITARAIRNTENALLAIKRKSPNLMDGISSVSFRKIGDSDAVSSMKRIPGISVSGGKYIYVRGLGDRYTKTILNGVDIPGLDPDRNTLQMDIFPTNIVDNIIVHKSFSADLPADFTGGVIDIAIKDFPEEKKGNISMSVKYNPGFHFNSDYLTYEGGKTDFLGFDDGTRAIPATSDIPFFSEVVGDPDGERAQRYREILMNFNPTMAAMKENSFMDYGFGASLGNQFTGTRVTIGYNFALSYKSSSEFYENAEFGRYGLPGNPDITEMEPRAIQTGDYGTKSAFISGLAGFALKTLMSKYRINLLHLQNGESKAGIFDYSSSDQGTIFDGYQHNLDYGQRSLTNILVDGKHTFSDSKWEIVWKLSPTLSMLQDPDIRFTRYVETENDLVIGTESGFPERIWRELEEINLTGLFHVSKELRFIGQKAKLQFGGVHTYKERDFVIRNFALNIRNIPLTGDPDELLKAENLWPYQNNVSRGTAYEAPFIPVNPNQFNATTNNSAGYISAELGLLAGLKTILGVRFENYTQRYTGQDQLGINIHENDLMLDNLDIFPSFNLIYNLSLKQNLRFSYSKTIARPSFKELSYAEIYDPISDRTFIGGLFRDANDFAGIEYWDGNLVSTDIYNFDLRWELFMTKGQMISLTGFYKKFNKPIEIVQYATQTGSFQPRNVGDGQVYGVEMEFRLDLESLSEALGDFSVTSNLTLTKSRIKLSKTEYDSRVLNARTGQTIDKYREMAGQAPLIINSGISYNGGKKGFWKNFEAGIYYNVQGQTLQYVGIVDRPDIYSQPFHSLNFNSNTKLGKNKRIQLGLKIENILNDKKESVFKSFNSSDQYFTKLDPGFSVQFKLGCALF